MTKTKLPHSAYNCPLCDTIMPLKDYLRFGHKCNPAVIKARLERDEWLNNAILKAELEAKHNEKEKD